MPALTDYFGKSLLLSGLLVSYYWIFLRNRKFNAYNRFYLLIALIISLGAPFLHITWYRAPRGKSDLAIDLLRVLGSDRFTRELFNFSWANILLAVSFLLSLVFLVIFAGRIHWIYSLRKRYPGCQGSGFYLVETELEQAPFSFLNNLFWKKSIDLK